MAEKESLLGFETRERQKLNNDIKDNGGLVYFVISPNKEKEDKFIEIIGKTCKSFNIVWGDKPLEFFDVLSESFKQDPAYGLENIQMEADAFFGRIRNVLNELYKRNDLKDYSDAA